MFPDKHSTIIFLLLFFITSTVTEPSTLGGKQLRIYPFSIPPMLMLDYSESGEIIGMRGPAVEILDYLAEKFHFTYTMIPTNITQVENTRQGRGALSYFNNKEADMIVGPVAMTPLRQKNLDFLHPWYIMNLGFMIPYPEASIDILAISKSYQYQVYVWLLVSSALTAMALNRLSRLQSKMRASNQEFDQFDRVIFYLLRLALYQGDFMSDKSLTLRLIGAVWCLTATVWTSAYSGQLVAQFKNPAIRPLINSMYDIPKSEYNVKIVVAEGLLCDQILSGAKEGFMKQLGNNLNTSAEQRCTFANCVDLVRKGSHVYFWGDIYMQADIYRDFRENSKCGLTLTRDKYLNNMVAFALPKNTTYTQMMSQEITRLTDNGMIAGWIERYAPKPTECLNFYNQKKKKQRLNIKHLSPAFFILAVGYIASIVAFVRESCKRHRVSPGKP